MSVTVSSFMLGGMRPAPKRAVPLGVLPLHAIAGVRRLSIG
jgi:hypothetical protein